VPALIFIAGFTQLAANGTSLGALLLPVGLLGALIYFKAGHVRIKMAIWLAAGLFTGSMAGAYVAIDLQGVVLESLFGLFLLITGLRLSGFLHWLFRKEKRPYADTVTTERHPMLVLFIGLAAGILSGLFGIGGGVIIVPALVKLIRLDQKTASGTCLAALLPPVGLPGIWVYHKAAAFDLHTAIPVALGLMAGAMLGAQWALRTDSHVLRQWYGILLIGVGLKLLLNI